MSTYIPVTTLSNLRDNFVPPSLSDLFYLQQGSEHDRDSAGTLGQILASQVIQSFLSDRDNWRTFTAPETGIITLGDYNRNVIIVPSAKDQSITLDHYPDNGLIIYAPDWDAESASTAVTIAANTSNRSFEIYKGGVGIFLVIGDLVIGQSLIGSSDIDSPALALAHLKELTVDDLIVKSGVALQYGSNEAFNVNIELRTVGENTYRDLVITKVGDSRSIKILGDTFQVVSLGIKELTAEHIDSDLVASKRRVYKDVDISGGGDSLSNTQTQYETSLGHSTSFYHLGGGATIFTFDKTTCEIGEEVLLFKPSST